MSQSTQETLVAFYDALHTHFGPQGWWPGQSREEVIIGAVLTQNTAWRNVELAIDNLRRAGCLDLGRLRALDRAALAALIRPAGTYNVKAKRLKALVDWQFERFDGDLDVMFATEPVALRAELLGVPGIGPETCDAILLYAGEIPTFVVDAYTHRILSRHGLIDENSTYDEIKARFEDRLPPDVEMFNEFHALLVAVGKTYCRPRARCDGCPLEPYDHDVEHT